MELFAPAAAGFAVKAACFKAAAAATPLALASADAATSFVDAGHFAPTLSSATSHHMLHGMHGSDHIGKQILEQNQIHPTEIKELLDKAHELIVDRRETIFQQFGDTHSTAHMHHYAEGPAISTPGGAEASAQPGVTGSAILPLGRADPSTQPGVFSTPELPASATHSILPKEASIVVTGAVLGPALAVLATPFVEMTAEFWKKVEEEETLEEMQKAWVGSTIVTLAADVYVWVREDVIAQLWTGMRFDFGAGEGAGAEQPPAAPGRISTTVVVAAAAAQSKGPSVAQAKVHSFL